MEPEFFRQTDGVVSRIRRDGVIPKPFKFIQSGRTSCGRGYSGNALVGLTSAAQRVINGAFAGCQAGVPRREAGSESRGDKNMPTKEFRMSKL